MVRRKVLEVIESFRAHFADGERPGTPLALRQESPDVIFSSLLEEDKPHLPTGGLLTTGLDPLDVPEPLPQAPLSLDEMLSLPPPPDGGPEAAAGLSAAPGGGLTPDDLIASLGG